jgi:hypothetical protein
MYSEGRVVEARILKHRTATQFTAAELRNATFNKQPRACCAKNVIE